MPTQDGDTVERRSAQRRAAERRAAERRAAERETAGLSAAQPDAPGRSEALERSPEERRADHAAIDRLADDLLPALVAKLGASGLGELQVREGAWRVRLRMPGDARAARRAGAAGRATGRQDGHSAVATHAPGSGLGPGRAGHATHDDPVDPADAPTRAIATSPAVGFFRPRPDLAAGARVRAGDRLGAIDVLGVPHELTAPADGIVGATLVEAGDPVEYGQDVVEIELPPPGAGAAAPAATDASAAIDASGATAAADAATASGSTSDAAAAAARAHPEAG